MTTLCQALLWVLATNKTEKQTELSVSGGEIIIKQTVKYILRETVMQARKEIKQGKGEGVLRRMPFQTAWPRMPRRLDGPLNRGFKKVREELCRCLDRGSGRCKGPEAAHTWACSRNTQESSVATVGSERSAATCDGVGDSQRAREKGDHQALKGRAPDLGIVDIWGQPFFVARAALSRGG